MRIYFILTAMLIIVSLTVPFFTTAVNNKEKTTAATEQKALHKEAATESDTVTVLKSATGETVETDITDYITGVVAGEMPASFSEEALKAQAVAAYTYLKYTKENTSDTLTDSSALHQSYIDKDEQKNKWGADYGLYSSIIENAVNSVAGEYVTYDGKTALTVFHAASTSKTNSAEEIWGRNLPYLMSVDAPSDEEFNTELTFTSEEFKMLFEEKGNISITQKDIKKWASAVKKNDRGYIRSLKVADREFTAPEIRDILSLPSVDFTGRIENDTFIFTVKGKGHGVGMSQYSAEYMARQGKSYKDILLHFYPGTAIEKE